MVVDREVETGEVERLRGQQQVLSHAMRVFAEATAAPHTLLDTVARETAEAMHAFCIFATTTAGGRWVEPVASDARSGPRSQTRSPHYCENKQPDAQQSENSRP